MKDIDTGMVMRVLSPIWAKKSETANRVRGRIGAGKGASVALSADGNTAIVGGPHDNAYRSSGWSLRNIEPS